MKSMHVSSWIYLPLKLALILSFFIPLLLWGGQLLGVSRKTETALAKRELAALESAGKPRLKALEEKAEKEGQSLASKAVVETERAEKEARSLLASAESATGGKKGSPGTDTRATHSKGIDVSHFQGVVRWGRIARAGIHFAFAKATGGDTYIDPRFRENWHGMRAAEIYRGAYHFFFAADDPHAQANHFVATLGKLREKDMPPMLDVEILDHTDPNVLQERVLVWLEAVQKATGRRPILYTDPGFADRLLKDPRFSRYPLWISDYAERVTSIPKPWKEKGWLFWQHSEEGRIEGIAGNVDLDVFKGDLSELKSFIVKSQVK